MSLPLGRGAEPTNSAAALSEFVAGGPAPTEAEAAGGAGAAGDTCTRRALRKAARLTGTNVDVSDF